jgi:hypothetical protein
MSNQNDDVLLWGGRAIGAAINIDQAKALRLPEQGRIKCAIKQQGRWTAWRNPLRREFGFDGDVAVHQHVALSSLASPKSRGTHRP